MIDPIPMFHAANDDLEILEAAHVNPLANHLEIWLNDPDGYEVFRSSPYGDLR